MFGPSYSKNTIRVIEFEVRRTQPIILGILWYSSVGTYLFVFFTLLRLFRPWLLCSLSGWFHLNCISIGTGFNGAETNCRIAHNLGILLMNSNCFAMYFPQHSSYVCSDIYQLRLLWYSVGIYFESTSFPVIFLMLWVGSGKTLGTRLTLLHDQF